MDSGDELTLLDINDSPSPDAAVVVADGDVDHPMPPGALLDNDGGGGDEGVGHPMPPPPRFFSCSAPRRPTGADAVQWVFISVCLVIVIAILAWVVYKTS